MKEGSKTTEYKMTVLSYAFNAALVLCGVSLILWGPDHEAVRTVAFALVTTGSAVAAQSSGVYKGLRSGMKIGNGNSP